jgi:hypothetical protein
MLARDRRTGVDEDLVGYVWLAGISIDLVRVGRFGRQWIRPGK